MMSKYLIRNAKVGEEEGGIACGPVGGGSVAEVELEDQAGNLFFVSLVDTAGLPSFYKTEESAFERIVSTTDDDIE